MTTAGRSNTLSGYDALDGNQNESDHYGPVPDVVRLLHCCSSLGEQQRAKLDPKRSENLRTTTDDPLRADFSRKQSAGKE
jgi:hypothetical protein